MKIRFFNYHLDEIMALFDRYSNNMLIRVPIHVFNMIKFYIFWIVIHYITTHIYSYLCTPLTIVGFILAPLLAISPQCIAINWMRTISIYTIENMWYILGIWVSSQMTGLFRGISQRIQ